MLLVFIVGVIVLSLVVTAEVMLSQRRDADELIVGRYVRVRVPRQPQYDAAIVAVVGDLLVIERLCAGCRRPHGDQPRTMIRRSDVRPL